MKLNSDRGWPCLLLAVAFGVGCGPAPDPSPNSDPAPTVVAPESGTARAAAREIMEQARFATLVTLGPDGHPQARVVDPFAPDSQFMVRVATNARSRKAAEIAADGRVTLLYFDAAGSSYVTLIGVAEAVRDSAERALWWKEDWATFYEDRNRGEDYLLIRVRPSRLEISSERHGIRNDSVTWRPVLVPLP